MRRIPLAIFGLIFVMASAGHALAQVPYGYINGSFHSAEPAGEFGNRSPFGGNGNAALGWGGELDLGLMSDNGATYIGHRWSDFGNDDAIGPEWNAMDRWVAGLRWFMLGDLSTPVTPLLGIGLTMGDSEMKRRIDPDDPNSEIRLKSKNDVGWLGEGGVDLRLPGRLGATGAVQYHRFDTSFDSAIFDNPRYKVEYWSFLIGLNLRFAGPNN